MAWQSSGTSNATLVEKMWTNKLINDDRVKQAFLKVPHLYTFTWKIAEILGRPSTLRPQQTL